jgi:hypothetical protein
LQLGFAQVWLDKKTFANFIAINFIWTYIIELLFVNLYFYIFNLHAGRQVKAMHQALPIDAKA